MRELEQSQCLPAILNGPNLNDSLRARLGFSRRLWHYLDCLVFWYVMKIFPRMPKVLVNCSYGIDYLVLETFNQVMIA